jgi:hypothetical protein
MGHLPSLYVTPQIWTSKFVSRNLRFPRDIAISKMNSRNRIYFSFKDLGIDNTSHKSWLNYLNILIRYVVFFTRNKYSKYITRSATTAHTPT